MRVRLDAREEFTPGWKFSEYEMRGVPLRIEIGPRDVKAGQAVLVRRDTRAKEAVPLAALAGPRPRAPARGIQAELFGQARSFLEANIRDAADYAGFKEILENQRGFVRAPWCGDEACEDRIKTETMATIRVIPLDEAEARPAGPCVCCGRAGEGRGLFRPRLLTTPDGRRTGRG